MAFISYQQQFGVMPWGRGASRMTPAQRKQYLHYRSVPPNRRAEWDEMHSRTKQYASFNKYNEFYTKEYPLLVNEYNRLSKAYDVLANRAVMDQKKYEQMISLAEQQAKPGSFGNKPMVTTKVTMPTATQRAMAERRAILQSRWETEQQIMRQKEQERQEKIKQKIEFETGVRPVSRAKTFNIVEPRFLTPDQLQGRQQARGVKTSTHTIEDLVTDYYKELVPMYKQLADQYVELENIVLANAENYKNTRAELLKRGFNV